jgi:hypothetical protein
MFDLGSCNIAEFVQLAGGQMVNFFGPTGITSPRNYHEACQILA